MNAVAVLQSWEGRVVDGKFRLLQRLGGTTCADTFLTELPEQSGKKAVIKLFSGEDRNASNWDAIAKLSHPNLIRLLYTGRCELNSAPMQYAVMEYADEDLSQILPSRALTAQEAGDMLRAMVGVIAFIHTSGFVHGHIKPSNVMAVGEQLKLSSDSLQPPGKLVDKPSEEDMYAAPEIRDGRVSLATDVWSLGMLAVAALTQSPVKWDGSGSTDPRIPESIPEPFREIARQCLRVDPEQRCSLQQISARLNPPVPTESAHEVGKGRMVAPVAAGIVLIAVIAALTLMPHRNSVQTQKSQNVVTEQAQSPPPSASVQKGTIPGTVSERVLPDISRGARNTVHGKIKVTVRVNVNADGRVSEAALEHAGPSKYFAREALSAARRWTFTPAQVNGRPVASKWKLQFRFSRGGTDVVPAETNP